ncbi:hypothetical protein BJX64DRAFT_294885 [Aspergillus heterothallicus]
MPSSAAAAAALSACMPGLHDTPTITTTCVISLHNNYNNNSPAHALELVESCCGGADAISYSDCDCDYYCIAQGQSDTVGSLANCLAKAPSSGFISNAGIVQVWCNDASTDVDASDTPGGSITVNATSAVATKTSTEPSASTTPTRKGEESEDKHEPTGTKGELETIISGGEAQGNSVGVTTAILLALMAFGGAVRPVP